MANKAYNIVPEPDAVIVLRNPLQDFAVWEKPTNDAPIVAKAHSADDATETPDKPTEMIAPPAPERSARSSLFGGDTTADLAPRQPADDSTVNAPEATVGEVPVGGIHYHCSAAHLKLASKTFEKALSGDWAETVRKDDDGRYYIVVEDWDEAALLILLNIIHLRNNEVPRKVDIEMLTKLAMLIDYYQCLEATAWCTEKWTDNLVSKHLMPTTYCRRLILWLCVACVFKLPNVFYHTTMAVINTGTDGTMRTLGLPIPQTVSGKSYRKTISSTSGRRGTDIE